MAYDPFCDKGIYDEVFLETRLFFAVPNMNPILPGHTLVVPKRHVLGINELSGEEMADFGAMMGRLIPGLLEAHGTDSYNMAINCGEIAGMSVAHMHVHVIPRHRSDVFRRKGVDALYESLDKGEPLGRAFKEEVAKMRKLFRYEPAAREG
jgi:bis(5'-adenosyl)-triphosphatase